MKNLTNGVDIQGMGNTMDFKTVLTLYSSSQIFNHYQWYDFLLL